MSYTPNQEKIKISSTGDIYTTAFGFLGYDAIVGAQEGATHTSLSSAISSAVAGNRILILSGTITESIIIDRQLTIEGVGRSSVINGTVTFTTGGDWSKVTGVRITNNITINSGANSIFLRDCWQDAGRTLTNSGTGNSILLIRE